MTIGAGTTRTAVTYQCSARELDVLRCDLSERQQLQRAKQGQRQPTEAQHLAGDACAPRLRKFQQYMYTLI